MATAVVVRRIAPCGRAVRDGVRLHPELVDAVYAHLADHVGRSFDGSRPHTERLAVVIGERRHAVTAVFFVDTDGTLNVLSIEA